MRVSPREKSWQSQDSNPGQQSEKCEHYLCAMPPPCFNNFVEQVALIPGRLFSPGSRRRRRGGRLPQQGRAQPRLRGTSEARGHQGSIFQVGRPSLDFKIWSTHEEICQVQCTGLHEHQDGFWSPVQRNGPGTVWNVIKERASNSLNVHRTVLNCLIKVVLNRKVWAKNEWNGKGTVWAEK